MGFTGFADRVRTLPAHSSICPIDTDSDAVRHSRLQCVDSLPLPSAEKEVNHSTGAGQEAVPFAERQFDNVAGDEVMRNIVAAWSLVQVIQCVNRRAAFLAARSVQAF